MMAALREWLTSVTVVMLLISLAQALVPEGALRSIAAFAGGLILLAVLIEPLPGTARITEAFRFSEYAAELDTQQQALETYGAAVLGDEIARLTAAAIEEKAAAMGLQVTAAVETVMGENGTPLPRSAEIYGEYSHGLSEWIKSELGISVESQTWRKR